MIKRFSGIRIQLGLLFTAILLLANVSFWVFYTNARTDLETDLDEALRSAASMMARDGHGDFSITLRPGDENTRTYRNIREKLSDATDGFRLSNSFIVDSAGNFLVGTTPGVAIGEHMFLLDATEKEMREALSGHIVATVAYRDKDGQLFKSAFAPVRNGAGDVVGVLVVEASARFLGQLDRVHTAMILVSVVSAVALVVLMLFVSLSVVRPLLRMARAASAIGEGNYETVEAGGTSELRSMSMSFNEMSLSLAANEAELRKLYELEARRAEESQQFAETILRSIATGVVSIDRDGIVRVCNSEACRMLAIHEDEIVGHAHHIDLMPRQLSEILDRVLADGKSVRHGQLAFHNHRDRRVVVSATAGPSADGTMSLAVNLIFTDQTEVSELQDRVKRHETLAAIGQLAAQMAHEVRNPLSSIKVYMDLIARPGVDEERRNRFVAKVSEEVSRLDEIVSDFLEYAAPNKMNLSSFVLSDVVRDALMFARRDDRHADIHHEGNLDSFETLRIVADRNQIMTMFLNLVLNAAEAMPGGGVVRTMIAETVFGNDMGTVPAVSISIVDTGTGIPEKDREHILKPFYSTKPLGTGLGLALVQRVVENHSGELAVVSAANEGTTITVTLPIGVKEGRQNDNLLSRERNQTNPAR